MEVDSALTLPFVAYHFDYSSLRSLVCVSKSLQAHITKLRNDPYYWETCSTILKKSHVKLSPITYDWLSGWFGSHSDVPRISLLQSKENCTTIISEVARYERCRRQTIVDGILYSIMSLILKDTVPLTTVDVLLSTYPHSWSASKYGGDAVTILLEAKNATVYLHFRQISLTPSQALHAIAKRDSVASEFRFYLDIDPAIAEEYDEGDIRTILETVRSAVDLTALADYARSHLDERDRREVLDLFKRSKKPLTEEIETLYTAWGCVNTEAIVLLRDSSIYSREYIIKIEI